MSKGRAGRQVADNKSRFKAMVEAVREASILWDGTPMPFHAIAKAIRDADARAVDDRTAIRWVVYMIVPPESLWKDGAILEATGRVSYGASGKVRAKSVMRNSYKVLPYKSCQVTLLQGANQEVVIPCR